MNKLKKNRFLIRILRIVFPVVLILLLGYGILLTVIGSDARREISEAEKKYPSVTVRITELRRAGNLSRSMIIVLETENEPADLPDQLGQTIATTTEQKLAVGDRLTMYYDPEQPQTRVIDFGTAEPQLFAGRIMTGGALLLLVLFLTANIIRRKKHRHPTAVTPN